jgi:hypothetical protein
LKTNFLRDWNCDIDGNEQGSNLNVLRHVLISVICCTLYSESENHPPDPKKNPLSSVENKVPNKRNLKNKEGVWYVVF